MYVFATSFMIDFLFLFTYLFKTSFTNGEHE